MINNSVFFQFRVLKRVAVFLVILFSVISINGQPYLAPFKADMCQCLEQESLKRKLTDKIYKSCFRSVLPKYATQIDAQIIEEDSNKKYYKGQVARKDLAVNTQYQLIYSCDTYFNHLNAERLSKKLIAQENTKETHLEPYNQQVALTPNALTYFMRAQLQFNLGNLKEAEADIHRSIDVNPNKTNVKSTRHELLLLAWIYEEQKRYTDAVTLYDRIYLGDFDAEVAKLRALADKKSGGISANLKMINKAKASSTDKTITRRTLRRSRIPNKDNVKNSNGKSKDSSRGILKKKDTSSLKKLFKIDN